MGLYDFTIYDLIKRNAVGFRDKQAWIEADDDRALTFAQYKEKVDHLACGLLKSGIEKGDRIGVLGKNSVEFFLLYGAASALGAIMLPVNWRLSAEEVAYNMNDCSPKVVFIDRESQELFEGVRSRLGSVEKYFNLESADGRFPGVNSLMDNKGEFEPIDVSMDDGFVIIHTAAVSGRPRGALVSHGNLILANMQFDYFLNITPDDVHLNLLPLFHVGGLFMTVSSFQAGALSVNMRKFDAERAVELIQEKKVSMIFEFAPILTSILDQSEKSGMDIRSLRAVAGLDMPETIEKYQAVTGGTFYCLYGQTETASAATFAPYNDSPGSAGKPLPLAEVVLVDDYDHPVPTGQVGEITVKGPIVFKGYWNLPDDTAHTFRGGRHHTGDLGRFDENGVLWYAGRKAEKELIKPGGENVYPSEVEKAIIQHPAIKKTVVFGVPDPKWKEGIKAVCQLNEGQSLEPQELIDFVGERIARFKKPQYVEFVLDFPVLEDGSPDRARIKKLYGGDQ